MKTKYFLRLVELNLALTTIFAAALPLPNSTSQSAEGRGTSNAPMIVNPSNVKAIETIEQNAKHKEMVATLKKIEEGAKKGDADQIKKRADLVASFQKDNPEGTPAGNSDEEIFSKIIANAEQELADELVEIAQELRDLANPPVQGAEVASPAICSNRVHK